MNKKILKGSLAGVAVAAVVAVAAPGRAGRTSMSKAPTPAPVS